MLILIVMSGICFCMSFLVGQFGTEFMSVKASLAYATILSSLVAVLILMCYGIDSLLGI